MKTLTRKQESVFDACWHLAKDSQFFTKHQIRFAVVQLHGTIAGIFLIIDELAWAGVVAEHINGEFAMSRQKGDLTPLEYLHSCGVESAL
jgi:hypothetical protein